MYSEAVIMIPRDTVQAAEQHTSETNRAALSSIRAHWMSNVIHDLRGPLFAARGYTKLMLENRAGDVTVTQQRYLTSVLENISKLEEIIARLNDLPCDDALTLQQLSFRELVAEVVADWRRRENLARMSEHIAPEPMHTIGDPMQLSRAVHKLLGSAVDFTQYGGKIDLSVQHEDDEITLRISAVPDSSQSPAKFQTSPDVASPCGILRLHGGVASVDCVPAEGYHVTCRLPVIR
jgi:signal transduction histidine kinase